MALSAYIKTQINGVLTKRSIEDIYLDDFYIQSKESYTYSELINYLIEIYDRKIIQQRSNKMLSKVLRSINLIVKDGLDLIMPISLYFSLIKLRYKYAKYLKDNDLKIDDNVISGLDELDKLLSKANFEVESENNISENNIDDIMDLQNKITHLEDELNLKKIQIIEKDNKYAQIKKELKDLKAKLRTLKKENGSNIKLVQEKVDIINTLNQKVEALELQVSEQIKQAEEKDNQISNIKNQNVSLSNQNTNYSKTIDSQAHKLSKLKKELKECRNQIEQLNTTNNQEIQNEKIDEAILMLILENDSTIDEFKQSLKSIIGDVSVDEIYASINRLKLRYSFSNGMDINLNPVYKLSSPNYSTNISINFEVDNFIDIIAISDLHMSKFSQEEVKNINYIYEYAVKNGIKTIINLGDLFDFKSFTSSSRYNDFKKNNDMIDSAIKFMPYDKSIHHLIMGGNHDKLILGVDAIKTLCDERKDFIDLGYDHARLILGNDAIYLHHIDTKFDETIQKDCYTNKNLLVALRRYYEKINQSRNKSYLDLLGHVHKSSLSLSDGYAVIPSLNIDRFCNGAWHLKIYFDKDKNISNIIFIPLVFNSKVQANTEIVYKKMKK